MLAANPPVNADRLFRSMLTPRQRDEAKHLNYFTVTGSKGGVYKIRMDTTVSNIISEDRRMSYCLAVCGANTYGQIFLCQKLCIEADEEKFLRTAYGSRLIYL